MLASVGPDGALLVGTPSAASTAEISSVLAGKTASAFRYVVIAPQDLAHSQGDAGWQKRGAFVAMQENALARLGGHMMGPSRPLPAPLTEVGADRPRIAFSEVLTFDLNGDAIHVVHQKPGYSDADSVVHFHTANLIYLGEAFPGDGYPALDTNQGGTLEGLLKTLEAWTGNRSRVVPARGKLANGSEVKAFHDMIAAVREKIQKMAANGMNEQQVLAEHPTAEFDQRWGRGRVSADAFVRAVYHALKHPEPQYSKPLEQLIHCAYEEQVVAGKNESHLAVNVCIVASPAGGLAASGIVHQQIAHDFPASARARRSIVAQGLHRRKRACSKSRNQRGRERR